MPEPRWKKIKDETGCSEKIARTASRALMLLGEVKGTAFTLPKSVREYVGNELAWAAANVLEHESD